MKDFNEFLKLVEPDTISRKAVDQARDKLNDEYCPSKNSGNASDYKTVYTIANLLEQYHNWLHSSGDTN